MRIDLFCLIMIIAVNVLCVAGRDYYDPAVLTICLQTVSDMVGLFSVSVRFLVEMDNFVTSA